MTTGTISGTYGYGLNLSVNPTTVAGSGDVHATYGAALYGSGGTNWTLDNAGTLSSSHDDGIDLTAGGRVSNAATGFIVAKSSGPVYPENSIGNGIYIEHAPGQVFNSGKILSLGETGVHLGAGGNVSNGSSGLIYGYETGVLIAGGAGTIVNQGYIGGSYAVGVSMANGGRVVNGIGGEIGGNAAAVVISGDAGTVTNQALIQAIYESVALLAGGTIVNAAGAEINAFQGLAVYLQGGPATLSNAGLIEGQKAAAVVVVAAQNGVVTNNAGGVIQAEGTATSGVELLAGGTIVNNTGGSIQAGGMAADGVKLSAGGTVINSAGATISAALGAYLQSGPATLTNAGLIEGGNGAGVVLAAQDGMANNNVGGVISGVYGIELKSRGSVTNAGTIEAHAAGILAAAGTATIVNHGHVVGSVVTIDPATTAAAANYGGIVLQAGGTITNTGTVSDATHDAISIRGAPGTVVNSGAILGASSPSTSGIRLVAGGSVTNAAHGVISGGIGIAAKYIRATVTNSGTIVGSPGIYLAVGGTITNASTGTISATNGVAVEALGAITLVNQGRIVGNPTASDGIFFATGQITNAVGGRISGDLGIFGEVGGSTQRVVNQGVISGGVYGVALDGSIDTLVNAAGAVISAGRYAAFLRSGTLENAGTITDTGTIGDAVFLVSGYTHRLVVDPGAVFHGTVTGGNALGSSIVSTMELASGSSTGTISGLGRQFIDFGRVTVDTGATWNISGAATIGTGEVLTDSGTLDFLGGVLNTGSIVATGGTLFFSAGNVGTGSVQLKTHAVDNVTGASHGVLQFLDTTGTLDLNTPASFLATIAGFVKGDVIDLVNTSATSITWTSPNLVVKDGTTTEAMLRFSGSFTQSSFTFASDGHGGTFIKHT